MVEPTPTEAAAAARPARAPTRLKAAPGPEAPVLTVPDIAAGAGRIVLIEGGLVVPPAKGLGNQSIQRSGVLTPEGVLVPESVTWRGQSQVTVQPQMPPADAIQNLPGTWLFMGPLFGHFGHFLVESIARLWALAHLPEPIAGVLFVPKFQNRPEYVMATYRPFLEALGVDVEMRNVEDPTRVERLLVPPQGFGMFQMIEGSPEFRDFVRARAGKRIAPKGAPRIYVSRSALPIQRGSVLGEAILEERLAAEGYEVFHPQKHSFEDQIAAYRAAREVIAVDCSPLHLLALVGHHEQTVAVIARRDGDLDAVFARQINAFQGSESFAMDHVVRNWIEDHSNRPSRTSWGEVDFAGLSVSLKEAGLIEGEVPWPSLTEAQIAEQVERIGAAQGVKFKPYEGPPGTAPTDDD